MKSPNKLVYDMISNNLTAHGKCIKCGNIFERGNRCRECGYDESKQ